MTRSLVLNATWEPLCVVSGRRAVCLVLAGKAEVLDASDEVVHSEHLAVGVPSIVRLRYVVRVPFLRRSNLNRRAVFARDEHRCQYCGERADSIDHVLPRSKGGRHEWENVVAACRPCNVRKRDRLLEETSMRLSRRPAQPRDDAWIVLAVDAVPEGWAPYLRIATPLPSPA